MILRWLCLGIVIVPLQSQKLPGANVWPYVKLRFGCDRLGPINLETSSAKFMSLPPLVDVIDINEPSILENTGQGVQARAVGEGQTILSGGVLLNQKYRYTLESFNWAGTPFGRASTATDGHGSPLQTQAFFYNIKYGSFQNALKFPDGLAIILINVRVQGNVPNLSFSQLGSALENVRIPGSQVSFPSTIPQIFYNTLSHVQYYYSYPGSYIDPRTRQQYPCATIIQIPDEFSPFISAPQFSVFNRILNLFGLPTPNVLPLFPQGNRPVIRASGFVICQFAERDIHSYLYEFVTSYTDCEFES